MISKHKILNAISEGIKTGFKFSSNSAIDSSSSIDFSDSKINNVESLSLNTYLKDYVHNKSWIEVLEFTKKHPMCKYKVNDSTELKDIIRKYRYKIEYKDGYRHNNTIDLNWLDVSEIEDMTEVFSNCYDNIDISKWNVSNVKNMTKMFMYVKGSIGDISKWDVSNVENMHGLFMYSDFNGDISQWDVSNVNDMQYTFAYSKFNGDISQWDVLNVKNMRAMFSDSAFNGDISNWNVSNVLSMYEMFDSAIFNGDISNWNVSNVRNMSCMFYDSEFNNDISKWKIGKHTNVRAMFDNCLIEDKNKPKS